MGAVNANAPALLEPPGARHQEASPDAVLSLCTPAGRLMVGKTMLATYLRRESLWREEKAVAHPGDRRNAQSAATLEGALMAG